MWLSKIGTIVGFILLAAGLGAIFTGGPWIGITLVLLAIFVLGV